MKYLKFVIVLLNFSVLLNAQSDFTVFINGSVNYTPMRNIEHDFITWNIVKTDKFNYSPNVGLKYSIKDYHRIYLNLEYMQVNLSYGVYSSDDIHYELLIYPIEVGYEYKITSHRILNSYFGAGLGYVFLNSEYVYQSGPPSYITNTKKDEGFSITFKYGLEYGITDKLNLFSEARYRYIESLKRNNYRDKNNVNLSGISLLLGVQLKI